MMPPQIGLLCDPPQTAQQSLLAVQGQFAARALEPRGKAHSGGKQLSAAVAFRLPPQIGFCSEPPQTPQQSLFPLQEQPSPLALEPDGAEQLAGVGVGVGVLVLVGVGVGVLVLVGVGVDVLVLVDVGVGVFVCVAVGVLVLVLVLVAVGAEVIVGVGVATGVGIEVGVGRAFVSLHARSSSTWPLQSSSI